MTGVWLENLTWPEAKAWIDAGRVVIIPVGAASKEHGHHLPLCTDRLLAEGIAERVRTELPVRVAPVLTQGYYPAFRHYPGSQHIRPETYAMLIEDILKGFVDQGARHILVLNTGISTEPILLVSLREFYERTGVRVALANISALGRETDRMMHQTLGGHGDEHETSIILALAPERVRMMNAQSDYGSMPDLPRTVFYQPTIFREESVGTPDHSLTGVRGDPTLATREKGEAILAAMTRDIVSGLRVQFSEALA